ncbi:MAG: TVP38/TMEM64 family protein [Deltaproteobacteria bacterium]|nr:TVP38/TMEM64 family protein [Deltaproteobacteria bacterium]
MTSKTSQKKSSPLVLIKVALVLSLFLFLFITGYFWDVVSFFDPDRIQIVLSKSGPWAPILFMIIMALAVVISPIPSVPLDVAAGAFFGPLLGTLYSAIGASLGAVASFLIARFLGGKFIERFISGHISVCTQCSDKLLTKIIFLSRLLPFISFDIISYGAGLTKMSLKNFILATFLGMLPLTFVYNYFGAVMLLGGGLPFLLGLIVVLLFFLLPRWIERYDLFSLRQFFRHSESPKRERI